MRILFFGSSEFAVPTFRSIRSDGHEIPAVVTQPDRQAGRGKHPRPTPVKEMALEAGVEVLEPPDVNDADVVARLTSMNADLAYVAAFGQKIGPALLSAFPAGIINLHGSLLPAYRGAAPIQWAVIHGAAQTGVTVFRIVEKMDAGPILVQRSTAIGPDETADELHDRLARIGCDAVGAALAMLAADPRTPGRPQDDSQATKARKLRKADGRVAFDAPARLVASRVLGLWSWPGAACRYVSDDGQRIEKVTLARAVPYEGPARPATSDNDLGRLTEVLAVQCRDAELAVLEIKPAGGKLMDWHDFVNGRHVKSGDRLVPLE